VPKVETPSTEKSSGTRPCEDAIRAGVLATLGRPAQLLKVAVLPLWGNKFRVNVWTAESISGNGIPNSYFVTADEQGTILNSEPPIQKLY
jgi:hypothetical protein